MMNELQKYPAYKDSGVPWLGEVPEHWNVLPALAAYRPKQVKNMDMIEKTVLSLSYGRIIIKPPEKMHGLVPESFETYQIVDPGNIIVRTTDLQNDQTSLRIGHSQHRGIITSAYMCLETTAHISSAFGYQFLNAYDLLKIIYGFGSGLRQNLGFKEIKRMPVLIPPLPEQSAIVRFLDHTDRRIKRCILAKQKMIKLLEEQKQAIIHQAVTRGLDPNVRLKPSSVEWLGDVPEHWGVTLGMVQLREKQEKNIGLVEKRVLSLSYGRIIIKPTEKLHGLVPESFETYQIVNPGEIIIRPTDLQNDQRSLRVGFVQNRGIITSAYICLNVLEPLSSEYAYYLLHAYDVLKIFYQLGSGTRQGLKFTDFKRLPILIPPRTEQLDIIQYISTEIKNIDKTIDHIRREITLLQEYSTCLIADVVTGKLDVREAAKDLPEEVSEAEIPNEVDLSAEGDSGDGEREVVEPEESEA